MTGGGGGAEWFSVAPPERRSSGKFSFVYGIHNIFEKFMSGIF